jgi:transcriptional regulator with XRE-family HTH domain
LSAETSLTSELRSARERRGLSIAQVAEAARVPPAAVEAVEQGDPRILSTARGLALERHLRSFLGLPPRIQPPVASQAPEEVLPHQPTGTITRHDPLPTGRLVAGSFLITLTGVLVLKLLATIADGPSSEPGDLPRPVVAQVQPGLVDEAPAAVAAPVGEPPSPEPAPLVPEAPDAAPPAADPGVHRVNLRTVHPVKVRAEVDGQVLHDGLVEGSQALEFAGSGEIILDIGDLSRVTLEYNGQRIEPLHNLTASRRLVFVRDTPP